MNMKGILSGFVIVGMLCVAANATVCFDSTISCSTTGISKYDVDFIVTCGSAISGGAAMRGVSICSDRSTSNAWGSFVSNEVDSAAARKYCWCRIVHPVSTKWYLAYTGANSLDCADNCTTKCANAVTNSSFWSNAFPDGLKM